ncbi:MAG: Alkaline phosphatase synthesis sensor protein PhoR [Ferruginibacter sp.]|nr:Alkaline phosphatase synthesis sensor protein PhoR [Ferruginibacter sp.]
MADKLTYEELERELIETRYQLEEANDTIDAIRTGKIDALVVKSAEGHQVFTLKSADQTYRMFIEKMNEGAVTVNREGLILYCNSRFAEMLQLPLSKVIGVAFKTLLPKEFADDFDRLARSAWQKEGKGEISLWQSGNAVPYLFSLSTIELDEGTVLSIIVADLTLQKEKENQLLKYNQDISLLNDQLETKVKERTSELLLSREHFKFLAENIPVIAWTAQTNGELTYFNKRWYEYTGCEEKDCSFQQWLEVIHPEDREQMESAWNLSILEGLPLQVEFRLKRASDEIYRWHYANSVPHKDEKDRIISWFGIANDIDYQKKELEKKDEFISMVSHELRTPVTTLKGFTQLLMFSLPDADETVKGYLSTMDNQIRKLTRLISDLLDATKSNAGQLHFDKEPFDFNSLVTEVVEEMQQTTGKHRIRLELDEPVTVNGDKNRIGQVITNLLSNAIKYSPDSDDICVDSKLENGQIVLCVKDKGIGIDNSQFSKLYTRFFRVIDNATAYTFPGIGLGLYISRNIIEKHNGTMWVDSEPGAGSEFYFSLPIQ